MKILIKHTVNSPNQRLNIEFNSDCLIGELRKNLSEKLSINISLIQLTTKKCGLQILMTDTWPLSFFISSEVAIIKLNLLENINTRTENIIGLSEIRIQNDRSRGLSKEISSVEHLISISKSGSVQALQEFCEFFFQEIKEEDLINHEQECKWGALHYDCYYGHAEIVQFLVNAGANCNKVSIDEWTPLQLSCYLNKINCVKALLTHPNLQINKMTKFRGTALHLTCSQGNLELAKLLLESNAYMNLEDHMHKTPIEYVTNSDLLEILPVYSGMQQLKKYQGEKDPPTSFCSEVYLSNSFSLNDKVVFLYMDIENATLNRYVNKEHYLDKKSAELYIKLNDIQDVVYSEAKDIYFFKIIASKISVKYYSKHKEITVEWIERIKIASEYYHIYKPKGNGRKTMEITEEVINEESLTTSQDNIHFNCFTIMDEIGNGSFGTVYKVKKNVTGEIFAMKSLSKPVLQKHKQLKYAISECKIMRQLNHPFVVHLHYAFQTSKYLYLVLELCPNGDLYGLIEKKGKVEEHISRFYIAEVILALEYLHDMDIIYRDLKPANVLIDRFGHAKLADFGLAKENIDKGNLAMTMAGSPAYLPPEIILNKGASKASDIYGIGPLLFELLTGTTPYYCDNIDSLFQNIKTAKLIFPHYISNNAKELITQIMNRDPLKRPPISRIKRHPFFRKLDWEALLSKRIKPPKIEFLNFEYMDTS